MELRTIQYFLEIAYKENMTAAANSLHVSQSALSHQMQELESELGCSLFIRTNRQTLLTDAGRHFLCRAEEIISLVNKSKREFESNDTNVFGKICIGAGESCYMEYLGHAAKRLHDSQPGITFQINSDNADHIIELMEKGIIDFALLFEPVNKQNLNYLELPYKHQRGILVRKDNELASKDFVTSKDLECKPLIINARHYIDKKYIANMYHIPEDKVNIVAEGNLSYNKAMFAKAGLGIVLTTNVTSSPLDDNLVFVPLKPHLETALIIAWNKKHALSKACELYLDELKKEFAEQTLSTLKY